MREGGYCVLCGDGYIRYCRCGYGFLYGHRSDVYFVSGCSTCFVTSDIS